MAKGKKAPAVETAPASRNPSMDVYRPTIQHIISDHAGTVLDENKPEPEPDLTVSASAEEAGGRCVGIWLCRLLVGPRAVPTGSHTHPTRTITTHPAYSTSQPQEEQAATAAYNAADQGDGVDAPTVRKLLVDLGLTLSPEQQALYVDKFWADKVRPAVAVAAAAVAVADQNAQPRHSPPYFTTAAAK